MTANIVLFGATELSVAVADVLVTSGLRVAGVVSVGQRFTISYASTAVENVRHGDLAGWAHDHGVEHLTWTGSGPTTRFCHELRADLGIVAGWYHLVPAKIRSVFPLGCVGLHASLLPRLRGGAPLNWAILDGETETGVSLFQLGDGVDDGPVFAQRTFPVGPRDDVGDLVARSVDASLALTREVIPSIIGGTAHPEPQRGVPTYCLQRTPEDGRIDWRLSAVDIDRLIRAVSRPYRGAFTQLGSEHTTIWRAEPVLDAPRVLGAPGQLWRHATTGDPCVVTGDGLLAICDATNSAGRPVLDDLARAANRRFDLS